MAKINKKSPSLAISLTKEYFDKRLKGLSTKDDLKGLATKDELKGLATKDDLKSQTVELKAFAVEQTEELARIVNGGFEDVLSRLDVKQRVEIVERKIHKIEEVLHVKF